MRVDDGTIIDETIRRSRSKLIERGDGAKRNEQKGEKKKKRWEEEDEEEDKVEEPFEKRWRGRI